MHQSEKEFRTLHKGLLVFYLQTKVVTARHHQLGGRDPLIVSIVTLQVIANELKVCYLCTIHKRRNWGMDTP